MGRDNTFRVAGKLDLAPGSLAWGRALADIVSGVKKLSGGNLFTKTPVKVVH